MSSDAERARQILELRKKRDPLAYFTASPTQEQFLRRGQDDWASLITSVSRGGKSTVSCVDLAWVLRGIHPYRQNYKNLTIIQFTPSRLQAAQVIGSKLFKKSELLLPGAPEGVADMPMVPAWEIEKLNEPNVAGMKVPYECIMKNGNRLLFSWAGVDGIAKRIAGLKLDAAYVDENAGTPALFQELYPRLLDSQSDTSRPGLGFFVWSNTNVDYNEEFEAFQDRVKRGVKGFRIFTIGKTENPAINTEKREALKEVLGGTAARIRMEGDLTAGDVVSVFGKQWQDERHIAKSDIPVEDSDNIWIAYDPGVDHPMGMLAAVIKKDMPLRLNVVQCWNYRGETIEKDVDNLSKWLSGRKLTGFVYDTNLKNKDRGGGPSVLERMKELMAHRGIVPMGGWWQSKKNHAPGIAMVRHYLDPNDDRSVPSLLLCSKPSDSNGVGIFRQQMLKYRGREATKFTGEGGVIKKDDELCFVAGTKILMSDMSEKNIEDIVAGDVVMAIDGPARVLSAGMTGVRDVISVDFSSGYSLIGTPDHPVFTSRGLVSLDAISGFDQIPSVAASIDQLWPKQQISVMRRTVAAAKLWASRTRYAATRALAAAFDPTTANLRHAASLAWMMWCANAQSAGQTSLQINTRAPSLVPVRALAKRKVGQRPVFNLTVDRAHSYMANGIAVSNCDSFRYLCMCRPAWNKDFRCGPALGIQTQAVAMLDPTGTIPQQPMRESELASPRYDFASGVFRSRDRRRGGRSAWMEVGV